MAVSADTTQLTLKLGGYPEDAFNVIEFTGTEYISKCFTLRIKAFTDEPHSTFKDIIGQPASVSVMYDKYSVPYHGIVNECNEYPSMDSGNSYEISIVPRLWLLHHTTQNRVFQSKTALEIVTEVLNGGGLSKSDFNNRASGKFSKREFTLQYNETDLNFIQRLLEYEGVSYWFDFSGGTDVLVLADKNSSAAAIANAPELVYYPEVGMFKETGESVFEIYRRNRMVTGKVKMKDYNTRTPESNIIGQAVGDGKGELYQYSNNLKTTDEAGRIASLRSEMLAVDRTVLTGRSDCRSLKAGFRFTLKDASNSNFDGEYLLTSVSHKASQEAAISGSGSGPTYVNSFTCIPVDVPYRPPLSAQKPSMNGVLIAKADGQDGPYAFLDEKGQYRVKLPFDLTSLTDGKASCPVRMGQPYSGPNYGLHFPVHKGAEIILGFEDGDIDRPIGLGSSPNPSMNSPVTSKNKSESVIRTASGHQIRMDDLEDKTLIEITTSGKHTVTMDDNTGKKGIKLKTTDDNFLSMDDKNEHITLQTTKGKNVLKLDKKNKAIDIQTEYGHLIKMDDQKKAIALQTKDGNSINLDDSGKKVTIKDAKGKHTIQIDGGGGIISITTDGDLELSAKGSLNVQAKEIKMEAKTGALEMKAMQDIKTEGMNVNLKGKQKVQIEGGMDVGVKGNMNLKLEGGMQVESKAGLSNKMTGVMVNAEASALNTIKGGMVMIN